MHKYHIVDQYAVSTVPLIVGIADNGKDAASALSKLAQLELELGHDLEWRDDYRIATIKQGKVHKYLYAEACENGDNCGLEYHIRG